MMNRKNWILFLLILGIAQAGRAGERRLQAMGSLSIAAPDIDAQINLYQAAGNMAWLKMNDSLNWMRYGAITENDWGKIQRHWDAERNSVNYFSFAGQKHITESQVFYGEIRYAWDTRFNAYQAIERSPYAADPFVLADSTAGNIDYYGPRVRVGFSQRLSEKLLWGVSLHYAISNGLKKEFTRPEILNREIQAGIDLAYQINSHWVIGLSFRPYQNQEYIRLVKQPDGSAPQTYRYRGEFEFRKSISESDRETTYEGFEAGPQIQFNNHWIATTLNLAYYYQWLELFDNAGGSKHYDDGAYQAEQYSANWQGRIYLGNEKVSALSWQYRFSYLDDWAREPNYDLMFYRSLLRAHQLVAGFSHQLSALPVQVAGEWAWYRLDQQKNDYLAQTFRRGDITDTQLRVGLEFNYARPFRVRAGYIYRWYTEDAVWNYFGDYQGPAVTFGFGIINANFEFDFYGKLGRVSQTPENSTMVPARRERLDLILELKTYF